MSDIGDFPTDIGFSDRELEVSGSALEQKSLTWIGADIQGFVVSN